MLKWYHVLKGMDDRNMKQTFFSSIPESLDQETRKMMQAHNQSLNQITLGEIYQFVLAALEKLCAQKKFFDDYL